MSWSNGRTKCPKKWDLRNVSRHYSEEILFIYGPLKLSHFFCLLCRFKLLAEVSGHLLLGILAHKLDLVKNLWSPIILMNFLYWQQANMLGKFMSKCSSRLLVRWFRGISACIFCHEAIQTIVSLCCLFSDSCARDSCWLGATILKAD